MSIRHPDNPNLICIQDSYWQGLPVQSHQGGLIEHYLIRIKEVINHAIQEHPRTTAFRVDLKFPVQGYEPDTSMITRFMESLKAQLRADTARKERETPRVHPCTLRYVWVKEQSTSWHWHYHVVIFLNRDRFNAWGHFKSPEEYQLSSQLLESINMADRMRKAWASALGMNLADSIGLVHFAKEPYLLNANSQEFQAQYQHLFYWLSYLAKEYSKHYGTQQRNFGCSQN